MEIIEKKPFRVVGKAGSTEEGPDFIARLWQQANAGFPEIEALALRNQNGLPLGIWGVMSDPAGSFAPWTDGFTHGLYLAGAECRDDAAAPEGWTAWDVPGFRALKVPADGPNVFRDTLKYMADNGLELAGAVHDFTDPAAGSSYMIFPLELKRE